MFDEKLYTIVAFLGRKIYPSYDELFIYENKKMMSYWLQVHDIPHVKTEVFYEKKRFLQFLEKSALPIVIKTNIGSTAKGVEIVRNRAKARFIADMTFGKGSTKLAPGYTKQCTGKILSVPAIGTLQRHFLIVQTFEKIKWEWRMIKIGDSYFGHKKLLKGDFASGSGSVGWEAPPLQLLHMLEAICEKGRFDSMAVDIFETEDGRFLVNELQSIFGSYDDSQMYIEGKPGRYLKQNGRFVFQEGKFNQHSSYLLRVKHFVQILSEGD
jgi:glutathione synthase/RimK-type ligase-like ATP-grasp enzyme